MVWSDDEADESPASKGYAKKPVVADSDSEEDWEKAEVSPQKPAKDDSGSEEDWESKEVEEPKAKTPSPVKEKPKKKKVRFHFSSLFNDLLSCFAIAQRQALSSSSEMAL